MLIGQDGADVLIGAEGSDTLDGGDGNDILSGGGGDDVLVGGAGSNVVVFSGTSAQHLAVLHRGEPYLIDRVANRDGTDKLSGVENVLFGSVSSPFPGQIPTVLEYTASYPDLMNAFGTNQDAAFQHLRCGRCPRGAHDQFRLALSTSPPIRT